MRNLLITLLVVLLGNSCGITPSDPNATYKDTSVATQEVPMDTLQTIDITNDDYTEDTTKVIITNTYFSVDNVLFNTQAHDNVKRVVLEFDEGEIIFCKLNNVILYGNATKKVNHQYKYKSTDIIEVQAGNTLEGIAIDHNTTVEKLRKLNPRLGKILTIGKTIRIK